MDHQTSSSFDRHALPLDILAPTIATVVDLLVFLNWADVDSDSFQEGGVGIMGVGSGHPFYLAFWLFPMVVAAGVNWWHPASTSTFRPFLAAVPQVLVVPLMVWIVFGAPLVSAIVEGSLLGLTLTIPVVPAGYIGT
jgi:hypothetical protein